MKHIISILGLICLAVMFYLPLAKVPQIPGGSSIAGSTAADLGLCIMDQDGLLQGDIYGAIRQTIDWHGEELLCDGMTRPGGDGVRLVFTHRSAPQSPGLVFVIGIGNIKPGETGEDLPTNVTVINEATGDFFNPQGLERCWATVTAHEPLALHPAATYRVSGVLYCAGSLPSIGGSGSVTLDDIRFSGRISLDDA